ncbi:hypothetical protein PMAYCL1PPCAC_12297 [Pristionchus mayeri]|uniref:Eukaryotic translation initiation factor 3 subunit A n=1 Tax=Pristionchus mayeri TaxID=1317129 RepID=A0AAN4ZPM9_9BILA|nr:hypothetical protein PMAYCL1PPCAC_12297 [Pristionchus mayeri]
MPPAFFQKPEAALKRAHELIQVGKEQDALDTLHDTIKARRHKQWSQMHEQIMLKHLELCVSLRKPHVAKDALFQYKALTQQVAVESLEKVIVHLLSLAEQKTEDAQKTSIEKVEEIDDLDNADAPENLLLSVVSGAAAQDRMDRTVLSPWLRFLWDSYRNCLELLRNNAQVEQLYHRITRKSFSFCSKYQRRAEFRKLCDLLRTHLAQIQKHQHLAHVVKLSSAESLVLMQETRLCQLDTAIQMELWQEAYRSAEDVHGMMQLSKDKDRRTVKPASYVNYYDKLALVFWKAGNRLFHAAALLQKFIIFKDMKKTFSAEEATEQATRVLLASLAIPDGADLPSDLTRHLDIEDQHLGNIRLLSNLLRLPIAPTRSGILKECARFGVPETASEEVRSLFRLLENNFSPLGMTKQACAVLEKIEKPEYAQYMDAIKAVAATKALKQISVIYEVISWERLLKIIPFYGELEMERFIVDVSKHRFVKAQIDHRGDCVRFGGAAEATLAGGVDLEDADGFTGDDTQLGVEGIRSHLEQMYNKLKSTVESLDGQMLREEALENVKRHASIYGHCKQSDYERILMRRRKIETYKESSERVKAEKTAKAAEEAAKREEQKRIEEKKRLEQENLNIEKRKREADKREVEEKVRADQMRKLLATSFGMNILREYGEAAIAEMDIEQVLKEQRERLDKERQQQQQRLQQQERKFDHWVRALHLEEVIERKSIQEKRRKEAPVKWKDFESARVQKAIDEHSRQVDVYNKLTAVGEEAGDWIEDVKMTHEDDFAKKIQEWEEKLDAVKAARLAERAEIRRKERRGEWLAKMALEEKRRKEEEERQKQQALEEQRRARRGENMDGRRREREERDAENSQAMNDDNWRRGAAPPPSRGMERRGPPRDFDRGPERTPMREAPSSNADRVDDWRSHPRPVQPPVPVGAAAYERAPGERPLAPKSRRDEPEAPSREDFGTRVVKREEPPRREAPSHSAVPEGKWERGGVIRRPDPVAAPSNSPSVAPVHQEDEEKWETAGSKGRAAKDGPAPAPAASQPWRPSMMRGGDASGSRNDGPPTRNGDFGSRDGHHRDQPPRDFGSRDGPQRDFGSRDGPRRDFGGSRDGPRRDFGDNRDGGRDFGRRPNDGAPPQRNTRGGAGAESDNNWRR